jgi:hypothetical protein
VTERSRDQRHGPRPGSLDTPGTSRASVPPGGWHGGDVPRRETGTYGTDGTERTGPVRPGVVAPQTGSLW